MVRDSWQFKKIEQKKQLVHQPSGTKEKSKLDFGWVPLFSYSLTVFVAVVFGAGKSYRQQYLSVFDFKDAMLPISFQDTVFLGITKQLPILLAAPGAAMAAVLIFAILMAGMLWLGNRLEDFRRLRKSDSAKRPVAPRDNGTDLLLDIGQFLMNAFGAVMLVSILALFFVARAETLGKTDGKADMAAISQAKVDENKFSFVVIERMVGGQKITEQGYLVGCSERVCGLYSPQIKGQRSRLIPLDNLITFTSGPVKP